MVKFAGLLFYEFIEDIFQTKIIYFYTIVECHSCMLKATRLIKLVSIGSWRLRHAFCGFRGKRHEPWNFQCFCFGKLFCSNTLRFIMRPLQGVVM